MPVTPETKDVESRACNTKGCDRRAAIDTNGVHYAYCPTCEKRVLDEAFGPRKETLR